MYKRVLLKLSGEMLAGGQESGVDPEFMNDLAHDLGELVAKHSLELVIAVGGGNFLRGKDLEGAKGLKPETPHLMGMQAINMNGMALKDFLESNNVPTYLVTNYPTKGIDDFKKETESGPKVRMDVFRRLSEGDVLVIAGGTGRPFLSSDSGAVETALDLDCELVIKATKVDGVHDKDPAKHQGTTKFETLTHQEAFENPDITVFDDPALKLAEKHGLPIKVIELSRANLEKAITGEPVGTTIGS